MDTPTIAEYFPAYVALIQNLASDIEAGQLREWDKFQKRVLRFFSPSKMLYFESKLPGWERMASYQDGVTLVHETAALTSLCMRQEYKSADPQTRVLIEWIVLFHDISKIARRGWRDHTHALRSAAMAGLQLPRLGFALNDPDVEKLNYWVELTNHAIMSDFHTGEPLPNKQEYPAILAGINHIYGMDTPPALIIKGVLFHMAINVVADYPQVNPLTDQEIRSFISKDLFPLLRLMMLVDNDAWSLFEPETRQKYNQQTQQVFTRLSRMLHY